MRSFLDTYILKFCIGIFIAASAFALIAYAQTSTTTTMSPVSCPAISRALSFGSRGSDVAALQKFLISQNLLAGDLATGYFGNLTQGAVQRWQVAQGIVSSGSPSTTGYGSVGPKTRAAIAKVCATTPPSTTGGSEPPGSYYVNNTPSPGGASQDSGGTTLQSQTGIHAPTVTLTQSLSQTTSDGSNPDTAGYFTVSWSSTNATSCTLQKINPVGTLFSPLNDTLGIGLSGSQQNHPPLFGVHHYFIDCTGPGGTVHQDVYHTVVARSPNIIVIMTDDMRADDIAVMPNVRHLIGDQGVTFTNSFVPFPLCCADRASFLTGEYPHNHGITGNSPATNGGYGKFMPQDGNTLPVWLQNAGYTTALIGKYLNGYGDAATVPTTYVPPGWNDWEGMPDALGTYNYFGFAINHNGTIESFNTDPSNYQTDVLGQRAVNFITSATSSKPFFLWFTPLAPHVGGGETGTEGPVPAPQDKGTYANLPLPQPPSFNEADVSDKPAFISTLPLLSSSEISFITGTYRNRQETLLDVDRWVGKLVDTLTKNGQLDNTVIVFTSDNGWSQGEHRRLRGKQVIYEESIRVPLLIRGPGIPKGVTLPQLVTQLDVVASIIAASHATPGHPQDGHSLYDLFANASAPWRSMLLVEGADVGRGDLGPPGDKNLVYSVRTQNYLYASHISTGENEFYNLSQDPYELQSRSSDPGYSSVTSGLAGVLSQLKNCAGASCWVTTAKPQLAKPTVTLTQSLSQTTSDGTDPATAGYFTVSWSSTNATSCILQKGAPNGTVVNPWASGTSGSQDAHPPMWGTHHWWIDCTGPGGTVHGDVYHTVVSK